MGGDVRIAGTIPRTRRALQRSLFAPRGWPKPRNVVEKTAPFQATRGTRPPPGNTPGRSRHHVANSKGSDHQHVGRYVRFAPAVPPHQRRLQRATETPTKRRKPRHVVDHTTARQEDRKTRSPPRGAAGKPGCHVGSCHCVGRRVRLVGAVQSKGGTLRCSPFASRRWSKSRVLVAKPAPSKAKRKTRSHQTRKDGGDRSRVANTQSEDYEHVGRYVCNVGGVPREKRALQRTGQAPTRRGKARKVVDPTAPIQEKPQTGSQARRAIGETRGGVGD
mmetsp:Transcript_14060/g.29379  ORF Transcript_14060/g.29379 Transcript_14060/m.29379 type:complete len:276 (+) Transcript_14060:790-1617(+)